MEKQRNKRFIKSGRRFLISLFLLLSTLTLQAQSLSLEQINALRLLPEEGQKLYTKTDIKFTVKLPNVRSSDLQIISTEQPQGINFRTVRKSENYGENGSSIEIWYNFEKEGNYKLKPLSVLIQNHRRNIAFEAITITNDPASMLPRMVLTFENGTRVYSDQNYSDAPVLKIQTGKKLHFTVNLQYANQLIQFNWELPKDSIFTCTKEYEVTEARHRERTYSHDLIPVADFEWTGLLPGIQKLPKFHLNSSGYNGYRSELYFPELFVEFIQADEKQLNDNEADIFSSAFLQESPVNNQNAIAPLTREECRQLAELYSKEHNEFLLYSKARKTRLAFEEEHCLMISANPIYPMFFLYISLLVIIASIIGLVIANLRKHKIRSLIFTSFLLLGSGFFIYCGVKRSEKYGISAGGKFYSIPQENAEAASELESGLMVRIVEETGKWYYIEFGESSGWCSLDSICIIK